MDEFFLLFVIRAIDNNTTGRTTFAITQEILRQNRWRVLWLCSISPRSRSTTLFFFVFFFVFIFKTRSYFKQLKTKDSKQHRENKKFPLFLIFFLFLSSSLSDPISRRKIRQCSFFDASFDSIGFLVT